MGIDLKDLTPTKISRDLRGKFLLIYGAPKTGKTTLLAQLPHSLILAFEPGTNALNNAYVQPIGKWTDFKSVLRQLRDADIQEKFHFIGIDTADIAYEMCERYICIQNNVTELGEIPWGKGYSSCKKEFADAFNEIARLGYGLCFVSHEAEKKFKNEKGEDYTQLCPALPERPYQIINKFVDIIGYIRYVREGEKNTPYLFLRGDDRFLAGSRFKYITPRVVFSYDNLCNAIQDSIDEQVRIEGAEVTNDRDSRFKTEERRSFAEAMAEARDLWTAKVTNEIMAQRVMTAIERVFGAKIKLSEVTEPQQDLLELVITEMKDLG